MPFLDEIADRLVAQGVGTKGADIFLGSKATIPPGDGPYLLLTETGGSGSWRTHNGTPVQNVTGQLLSRARSYKDARAKLKAAFDALGGDKGLHNIILSGTLYQNVIPRQQPTDVGQDDEARAMIAYNIEAQKRPS